MLNVTEPQFRKTVESYTPGAKTLARECFISPEVFAREEGRIFSRQWVCVGHQNQVPSPGDYFLANLRDENVIIVRDQGGGVRAHHNVCRHRGTRLCENPTGNTGRAIQCPYHAWTYALDGRLTGAPHMEQCPGFDKADYPLKSVPTALWEGFIFVNRSATPEPPPAVFAPLTGKFAHWNLPKLRSARRIEYDVRANWKLIFQNYSECYHCPLVHPELSKVSPYDSAENDLCEGPFLGGFMEIAAGNSLTMSGKACALPVGDIQGANQHRIFYYSILPNLLLSLHPDYVMVHLLWPRAPDRTLVFCDWYFHPDAFNRPDFNPDDAVAFWDMTNRQDWRVCELSQQGINSPAYEPGPYSPRESIPAAWDREYLRLMGDI